MLVPMSPTSSVFLMLESREHPMHVGGLQLFQPPEGATALDVRDMFDAAIEQDVVAPLFQKRARRSLTTLGQWGWELDRAFDLEHHVRRSALPRPGRIRELLALCSRLHSTLLDRHRPPWEVHLIEGLDDGRYAMYFKVHHALVDGVSALRVLSRVLSDDPDLRDMPPPWAPRMRAKAAENGGADGAGDGAGDGGLAGLPQSALRTVLDVAGDAVGLVPALARTVNRALNEQTTTLSLSAPHTILNVPITGARRFAAQSWPIDRIRQVSKASDATLNDVVLAMCSGALRTYLAGLGALPDDPLIAMVPVSLHNDDDDRPGDGGGNAIGVVMCNLGTHRADPADRLRTVCESMCEGKEFLRGMSPLQIIALSALGVSPVLLGPLQRENGLLRPPFNLVISNVPGPRRPMYWNGARLDGLYPLSIPLDGQALNITCTSYSNDIAFGLTGCRRTVPHLQHLLGYLDDELSALELATGLR